MFCPAPFFFLFWLSLPPPSSLPNLKNCQPIPPTHGAQDVDRQIRLIAEFVELEAREKSAEIRARAKADADAERQIALVAAKEKISEEYDRKEKAYAVELKMCAHRPPQRGLLFLPRPHPFLSLPPPLTPPHTPPRRLSYARPWPTLASRPAAAMPPWQRPSSAAACSPRGTPL